MVYDSGAPYLLDGDYSDESDSLRKECREDSFSEVSLHSSALTPWTFWSFSVGHVLNDMCAACWFTYLLVYLKDVAYLSPYQSGLVMLSGQIADGLATPLMGIFSDKSSNLFLEIGKFKFGKRKIWHLFGSLVVMICFFMVFSLYSVVPSIRSIDKFWLLVFYMFAASTFNIGWAAVQVSHMSIVPELSPIDQDRVALNSARYGFNVLSNVTIFVAFYLFIKLFNLSANEEYFWLGMTALIIGFICTVVFHLGTPESRPELDAIANDLVAFGEEFTWKSWLKCPLFFRVGFLYMCSRLVVNVSQVFLPFYIEYSLLMTTNSKEAITTVPLVVYLSSFVGTFCMKRIANKWGNRGVYMLGCVLSFFTGLGFYVITPRVSFLIYPLSFLLGISCSIIMISAVSMESEIVGNKFHCAAFVFGAFSFTDKVSNGIVVYFIQNREEITASVARNAVSLIPASAALAGLIVAMSFRIPKSQPILYDPLYPED